ncbi:MAG: 2-alkenal reductase [Planctomycetota bacterium]|nr:MAG: 2-alkenal reductase [Planctomycetota bacterium]
MTQLSDSRPEELRRTFESAGQGHVFAFWDGLSATQRQELLADLAQINGAQLPRLARLAAGHDAAHTIPQDLEPSPVFPRAAVSKDIVERGRRLISGGKVAAFTVAGGQGTRLGYDGPKGCFRISPVRGKPLFQLFAESILATRRKFNADVPWYIMTSPANDAATRAFFDANGCFGLPREDVLFFQQGVMPAFDAAGKILLDQPHRVALSPDGHGGSLLALATTGMLADMARRGIVHISYFQVDNPLVYCVDPVFIGLHDARGSDMSSKTLPKADDLERVGNFAMTGGRVVVIEYSDLPEHLARARNPDGSRRFNAANIAIHVLSRAFVERLTADRASFALPWHMANKKVPFVDPDTRRRVEPEKPNAVKLESFVFDALPLAENPVVMETSRDEEFSPVKNATGVDSVESARRDMSHRAARWLSAAGFSIPMKAAEDPDGLFEVSPLVALEAEDLIARRMTVFPIARGESVYLE